MIRVDINDDFTYQELEAKIRDLEDQVREEKRVLTEAAKLEVAQEINQEYLAILAAETQKLFTKLSRNNFPPNAFCSHHGVSVGVGNDWLTFGVHTTGEFRITIYRGSNASYPNREMIGYTRAQLEAKAQAICDALECKATDEWNGQEGSSGISLIVNIPAPIALVACTENSEREDRDSEAFDRWMEED